MWRQLSWPICCMSCYLTEKPHVHHSLLDWSGSDLVMNPAAFSEFLKVNSALCFWSHIAQCASVISFTKFLDHIQQCTTVGRTPLDEWSAHRRELYLTTYNSHSRETSMPPVGFEPSVSAGEWPQTYALDRAATGIGKCCITATKWSLPLPSTPV